MNRLILITVLVLGLLCPGISYSENAVLLDKVVAVVGKDFLTLYQLKQISKPIIQRVIQNQQVSPNELKLLKKRIEKEVLDQWIQSTILQQEAKKFGLKVSPEEVERYIEMEVKAAGGYKRFLDALKAEGLTFEEYKKQVKRKLLEIKLIQIEVHQKIIITQDELKKAYEDYVKNFYKTHDKNIFMYWTTILIVNGNSTLANKCYNLAKEGKDFEKIAEMFKNEVKCIPEEGYKREELSPQILKVLSNLKPGDISQPIKLGNSYLIIKLVKEGHPKPLSFDQIKDHLYQKIFQKKAQEFLKKWINELKARHYIKVYNW